MLRTAIYLDVPYYNLTQGILRYGYMYRCPRHKKTSIPHHKPAHPHTHKPTRPHVHTPGVVPNRTDGRTDLSPRTSVPASSNPHRCRSARPQKKCCLRRICKGMLVSSGARTRVSTCARTRARTRPGHAHVRTPRTYARTHPPFRITTQCTSQCPRLL